MTEHQIPSSLACIIFDSVREQMGENGLKLLLRQAGLERYIDNPPEDNDSPSIAMDEFKRAFRAVHRVFGEKAARPLLLRWGELTFTYALENKPRLFGLVGPVTKLMTQEQKERFILKRVLKESENLYNVPHIMTEDSEYFYVEIQNCFYCGDMDTDIPICHSPKGSWLAMMRWITGKEHEITEIACQAMGDESCTFRIKKEGT